MANRAENQVGTPYVERLDESSGCCSRQAALVSLAALGLIVIVGAAIAAWQLHGLIQNFSYTLLVLEPIGIGLVATAVLLCCKPRVVEEAGPIENKTWRFGEQVSNVTCVGCSLYRLDRPIVGFDLGKSKCVLVLGELKTPDFSSENPSIVYSLVGSNSGNVKFLDFPSVTCGEETVTRIEYNPHREIFTYKDPSTHEDRSFFGPSSLTLFYGNNPIGMDINLEMAIDGPQGQKFVVATHQPDSASKAKIPTFGKKLDSYKSLDGWLHKLQFTGDIEVREINGKIDGYEGSIALVLGKVEEGASFGKETPPIVHYHRSLAWPLEYYPKFEYRPEFWVLFPHPQGFLWPKSHFFARK